MLLMATALGFDSALTSGKAMGSPLMGTLFNLQADEMALCFISVGTALARKARTGRPLPADIVSTLV